MSDIIPEWTKSITELLRHGNIKRIETDEKTLDLLWFCMQMNDRRITKPNKRPPYGYVTIMGVEVHAERNSVTKA